MLDITTTEASRSQGSLWFAVCLTLTLMVAPPALAIDHKNLDESRPLRIEDAYTIASGEAVLEAGGAVAIPHRGSTRGLFPLQVLYGALPNLQIELGSTLETDPNEITGQRKSGDLQFGALYNFNQETLTLPAFGFKPSVNFPSGVDSAGVDFELKGIVTKSFGNLSFHLNGAYEFFTGTRQDERDGLYKFALGASYPVGAPKHTRTVLVADVFTEQSELRGDSNVGGIEVGVRHQLTPRLVVDSGIGTEFAGPSDRAVFFFAAGISFGF